jgi:hypothetical protein
MDILAMRRNGFSIRKIAKTLGIHRKTVKKYLEIIAFPQYQKREPKTSILEPYYQTIKDFLDQDDYQATWIFDRLRRMGHPGSPYLFPVHLLSLREELDNHYIEQEFHRLARTLWRSRDCLIGPGPIASPLQGDQHQGAQLPAEGPSLSQTALSKIRR